jgi:hypothetical protein
MRRWLWQQVIMKNDTEVQFRNIARAEYDNLIAFMQAKGLRVNNLTLDAMPATQVRARERETESMRTRRSPSLPRTG